MPRMDPDLNDPDDLNRDDHAREYRRFGQLAQIAGFVGGFNDCWERYFKGDVFFRLDYEGSEYRLGVYRDDGSETHAFITAPRLETLLEIVRGYELVLPPAYTSMELAVMRGDMSIVDGKFITNKAAV